MNPFLNYSDNLLNKKLKNINNSMKNININGKLPILNKLLEIKLKVKICLNFLNLKK